MRKKPNLIPRMERCAHVQIFEPASLRGKWRESFPQYAHIVLELGCGKGRFTAETAKTMPDTLYLALERVRDAMVVAMERVCAENIENVRFLDMDARLLASVFAPGEIERIYINFCDPWPPKRQAKRRLTHRNFLKIYRQVLAPEGEIHFKTDNRDLFDFSLPELEQTGFEVKAVTNNLHESGPDGIMTDYEVKFYEQGIPINRCEAVMRPWQEPEEEPCPEQDKTAASD